MDLRRSSEGSNSFMTIRKTGKYKLYRDLLLTNGSVGVGTIPKNSIIDVLAVNEQDRMVKIDNIGKEDLSWHYWRLPVLPIGTE